MSDSLTRKQRHYCMSQIKSKDTKPEIIVRKLIWKKGYRYRIGHGLAGRPDMVFPLYNTAVLIDGCFWHGCPKHYRAPLSNVKYWKKKISGNKKRDRKIDKKLAEEGWKVIRIWEHDIKSNLLQTIAKIINHLK